MHRVSFSLFVVCLVCTRRLHHFLFDMAYKWHKFHKFHTFLYSYILIFMCSFVYFMYSHISSCIYRCQLCDRARGSLPRLFQPGSRLAGRPADPKSPARGGLSQRLPCTVRWGITDAGRSAELRPGPPCSRRRRTIFPLDMPAVAPCASPWVFIQRVLTPLQRPLIARHGFAEP
jgi:hypothetical protein